MDSNETRYHLLLGYADWANCTNGQNRLADSWESSPITDDTTGLDWNDGRQELTLQPRQFQFIASAKDNRPKLSNRRGAGRDRFGNWYWIDETSQEIRVNSTGSGHTSHFWSAADWATCQPMPHYGDFQPQTPSATPSHLFLSGLAITEDHYLVVGTVQPAGILIFDLHRGGSPRQLLWPVPFVPFDMAAAPGGGVWILDREHRRYWALDAHFNVIRQEQASTTLVAEQTETFQPQDGGPERRLSARTFPKGITLDDASPLDLVHPIAIEALPDSTVLILEGDENQVLDNDPIQSFSLLYHYRFSQRLGKPVSCQIMQELLEEEQQAKFRLVAHDLAFVPEHRDAEGNLVSDRLVVVATDGNQGFVFDISQDIGGQLNLRPLRTYLPMRLFGGKGLVSAGLQAHYDFADRWIPLVEQKRPRYVPEAILQTPFDEADGRPVWDGHQPDCVWHRLMIEGCIPPGTAVTVWSRSANEKSELAQADWQPEPLPYQRGMGSELPFVRPSNRPGYGTWELLFQRACGRYLQLKLRLQGNGQTTPSLRALRAYYPRFSYVKQYLPAIYREAPASFPERFLANLEGFYTEIEDKIAAVQMLFDPRCTTPEALGWLESWFGIALDPNWGETRRRLFIKHAMDFFRYRGTMRGLLMALQLALDECPDETIFTEPDRRAHASGIRIVEKYRTRRTPGVVLGDPTEMTGLRLSAQTPRWFPDQGQANLHQRYVTFLQDQGLTAVPPRFPLQAPTDPNFAAAWQQFAQQTIRFIPAVGSADLRTWQDFLSHRYPHINAFNDQYYLSGTQRYTAFTQVPLPTAVPSDGRPLQDWYQFEAVLLPMRRAAHRFTVLLPVPKGGYLKLTEQQSHLDLAKQMVELEKPAHTIFEVKFYWDMFRIGEVRLGHDTVLGQGSRAPELMTSLILGQSYLAESYLTPVTTKRPPIVSNQC